MSKYIFNEAIVKARQFHFSNLNDSEFSDVIGKGRSWYSLVSNKKQVVSYKVFQDVIKSCNLDAKIMVNVVSKK